MKVLRILLVLCLLASCSREELSLYVLETSDLHGELGQDMSSTWATIRDYQKQYGNNVILLDCGDNLQGTSEVFFSNFVDSVAPPVYSDFFNVLGYDAIAVGNHDFEAGKNVYHKYYSTINSPILCANIVDSKTRKPIFKPYTILHKAGYKIAILGLVNTSSLNWIPDKYRENINFVHVQEAAQVWVRTIYEKEDPDVVIGLFHIGSDDSSESAKVLAQFVPGIHLICCGHIHKAATSFIMGAQNNQVCIMAPGSSASHLAVARINIFPKRGKKPDVGVSAEVLPMKGRPQSAEFTGIVDSFFDRAHNFYSAPLSSIDTVLYSGDALKGPCGWTDMLHHAYLDIASSMGFSDLRKINISIVSPSLPDATLMPGVLTLRDFLNIYPYENTMSIVEMNGDEIKQYLEYCYHLRLDFPDNPIYSFDTVSGIKYTVNKKKPYGERVNVEGMMNGNQFYATKSYRVAMSTFRACGGGGHLASALQWSQETMRTRCVGVSEKGIRAVLVDIYSKKPFNISPLNNWAYLE